MTKKLILAALTIATGAGALMASPIITLDPSNGVISGNAGDTIGWGFDVQADPTQWISFVASFTLSETNPSVGIYSDFISLQGGPVNAAMGPATTDWSQIFSAGNQTGIGSFTIDPSAIAGSSDSGVIRVLYQSFSVDPNTCFAFCTTTSGFMDLAFTVDVSDPPVAGTPEPTSLGLVLIGVSTLIVRGRRR